MRVLQRQGLALIQSPLVTPTKNKNYYWVIWKSLEYKVLDTLTPLLLQKLLSDCTELSIGLKKIENTELMLQAKWYSHILTKIIMFVTMQVKIIKNRHPQIYMQLFCPDLVQILFCEKNYGIWQQNNNK